MAIRKPRSTDIVSSRKNKLDASVFKFDTAKFTRLNKEFICAKMAEMNRDGILVPLSGGLDSSTVLLLCIRAVGSDKVIALLLPEKQGNPDAREFAQLIVSRYGVKTITRDITQPLAALGGYDYILSKLPSRALREFAVKTYYQTSLKNPFLKMTSGTADQLERNGFAFMNARQRVRLVMAYLEAEKRNLMVAGSAHKSEDLVGLYVKFGVDDAADIMPLKNLYRTQIHELGKYLGVPEEILARTPNPDIIPGITDKYRDLLGIPIEQLDLILWGLEHRMSVVDIAKKLKIKMEKVSEIASLIKTTQHMRKPSQAIPWN